MLKITAAFLPPLPRNGSIHPQYSAYTLFEGRRLPEGRQKPLREYLARDYRLMSVRQDVLAIRLDQESRTGDS